MPWFAVIAIAVAFTAPPQRPRVTVAAAADLNYALADIARAFEKQTGAEVVISFGSSGNLANQIRNGAPFDIFLSADTSYVRQLEQDGSTVPGSLYVYSVGRLVLWVARNSPLDLEKRGMEALLDPSVQKVAIANPAHAPYGRAAGAALKHFSLYDRVAPKFVLGENIAQAAQFVLSGNAEAGIIALSLASAPEMAARGRSWQLPEDSYPRLEQAAVLLRNAKDPAAAQRFLEFLKSAESRDILRRYGFTVPETKP